MITVSKQNYLKAIAEAEAEGQQVIPAALASWLSVSRPAVTTALKRLSRDGLVRVTKPGNVELTDRGRVIADRTILRHQLIERMLIEVFGMPWYEVHEEAERLEHAVSPAFEKKLIEKLGHENICPYDHGMTPRTASERRENGLCLLSEVQEGEKYRVASVYDRDRKLLEFFDREGIRPGSQLSCQSLNYDDTVTLAIAGKNVRLGLSAAQRIWVSKS
jgi:DtxR family Mn-dependent transcriptional regulator